MKYPDIPIPRPQRNLQWEATIRKQDISDAALGKEIWSFSPDYQLGLDGEPVSELFRELGLGSSNRAKKANGQALSSALLALMQSSMISTRDRLGGFLHSRKTASNSEPARYAVCDYKPRTFTNVLDSLAEIGFVRWKAGFKGKEAAKGLTTLFVAEQGFLDWLSSAGDLSVVTHSAKKELLLLRDSQKSLIDYQDNDDTRRMRQSLAQANTLRQEQEWSYLPLETSSMFVMDDRRRRVHPASLACSRIFAENFRSGGRFYCQAQGLRKGERPTLTINGQPTIELDYKSLHPRMLYNSEGLEAPADCYALPGFARDAVKLLSLLCVNCESPEKVQSAYMRHMSVKADEAKSIMAAYMEANQAIKHRFFKAGWKQLQYMDSQLAQSVQDAAYARRIPVLPVHDSFIVATEHGFWLKEAVAEAYRDQFGFDAVIDWEAGPELEDLELIQDYIDAG